MFRDRIQMSYKAQNKINLLFVCFFNISFFLIVTEIQINFRFTDSLKSLWSDLPEKFVDLSPFYAVLLMMTVISGMFSRNLKECLVFWSEGRPGERAFSHFMLKDSTINVKVLSQYFHPLPTEPFEQNALWYSWLHEFDMEPRIRQVYKSYLFAREWTLFAAFILITSTPIVILLSIPLKNILLCLTILIGQYFIIRFVARVQGEQLVKSVMSRKASSLTLNKNQP